MKKEEMSEWMNLCQEVAAQISPNLEEFIPNPLESAAIKRNRFIINLAKELDMSHYRGQIEKGVEAINTAIQTLSLERQQAILNFIDTYLSCLSDPSMAEKIKSEGSQGLLDLATAFQLDKEVLKEIDAIGMDYINKEQWREGEGIFALLCHWEHLNPFHWFHQSLSCYFAKQYNQALSCIEVALQLREEQPEFSLLQAALAEHLGERQMALEALHRCDEAINRYSLQLSKEWQDWKEVLAAS